MMRRCKQDLARLKQLKREAKQAKDKPAKRRIQTSIGMINLTRLKSEGWGLVASIVPIILLACWAFERLDYYPPATGDEVIVRATFPVTSIEQPTWLTTDSDGQVDIRSVPAPSADGQDARWQQFARDASLDQLDDSPMQIVGDDDLFNVMTGQYVPPDQAARKTGLAVWKLKVLEPVERLELTIHRPDAAGEPMVHEFRAGGPKYAPPLKLHGGTDSDYSTWVSLRRAGFLEYVPLLRLGRFWNWWNSKWISGFLPPWLLAYLVIAVIFVPLLRKVLRVY
jgi:hypothetical protein